MNSISCTIILSNETKQDMINTIADLSIYNISVYNSIRELKKSDLKKSNKVVVLGKVSLDVISDLRVYKDILNLDIYYLTNDSLVASLMSSISKVFILDYTRLDHNLLLSIFYNDTLVLKKYALNSYSEKLTVDNLANKYIDSDNENVSAIAKEYKLLRHSMEEKIKTEKELIDEVSRLNSQLIGMYSTNESLSNEIDRLISQYVKHHNKLKDFKIIFSGDYYDIVDLSKYKNKPKIIYFKEYQDFLHLESFISTISNIIKIQRKSSFKVIRLHDSCDVHRINVAKSYDYLEVDGKFLASEVIDNDYILSYGNYVKLFDLVLNSPLDYLIVIDCKKLDNVVLLGNYLKLNLCRNESAIDILNLLEYSTIVNNSNRVLSWDTYDRYSEFINDNDLFTYLSSRPVMQRLNSMLDDLY